MEIKLTIDTTEAEAALDRLIERAEKLKADLHAHKYQPLSATVLYCECGAMLTAPNGYTYPYNPYSVPFRLRDNG